ncbi:gamma-glutamyltransferase [Salipiger sp. PrR002]|uniref:gamma-glutamyltransferase n=1 Tax=Salipiger sp. PrR002 TaxID=2706489 RepID=UPI0013B8BF78|nr:gamma-glutamyltransferase [Salipiger sp. PrR002]NDV97680.1 gamma-glutamyltransferase [Salipiger sp. PrR002]NDW55171.1 gamma-glutamyltransferase [Salipiger sp. PrR004]
MRATLYPAGLAAALLLTLAPPFAGPLAAQQAADAVAPEAATTGAAFETLSPAAQAALDAKAQGVPTEADDWMIAAANPLAVEAGARVLREGGSAADAMVAVQAVLGLVEPQSSGLGGGAFLVWYDAKTQSLTTLDGRETAPLDARPTHFQDEAGAPLGFFDAVVGGLSVGTPGTPRLMEEAHRRWGAANWAGLFDEAIALAEDGFAVSPRLAELVAGDDERLRRFPETEAYFFPGGTALQAGQRITNQPYADTLKAIAAEGSRAFYTGEIAEDIVRTVREAEGNPGKLSSADLALYDVIERAPVCVPYRAHEVCGMGPPSSGALTVGQILGMLEPYDLAALGPDSAEAWRLIGDASRLAFADRGRYMADSDFVPMPTEGLADPVYLQHRAELLSGETALTEVAPGEPQWDHAQLWADDRSIEFPSTSHISIVDGQGNALSMTTTIENGFGSRLFVRGFLLNNELTDFSFATHDEGRPIANRLEPGKRPRSSMAPTIVMQEGAPVMVVGSPGGSRIIGYVAQAVINQIDWGMDPQAAVAAPHVLNRFGTMDIEAGTEAEALAGPLGEIGFETDLRGLNSGLHVIAVGETLRGGADPRREGIALGE